MSSRTLVAAIAVGRIGFGVAMLAAPKLVARPWLGADTAERPGAQVLVRAVGIRDLGIGVGTLVALRTGADLAPWMAGGVIADAVDASATLAAGSTVPFSGRLAVAALGGGSAAMQLAAIPGSRG